MVDEVLEELIISLFDSEEHVGVLLLLLVALELRSKYLAELLKGVDGTRLKLGIPHMI